MWLCGEDQDFPCFLQVLRSPYEPPILLGTAAQGNGPTAPHTLALMQQAEQATEATDSRPCFRKSGTGPGCLGITAAARQPGGVLLQCPHRQPAQTPRTKGFSSVVGTAIEAQCLARLQHADVTEDSTLVPVIDVSVDAVDC